MIGVVAREPVALGPFLDALEQQSRCGVEAPHADGYGLAVFTGGHWLHVREQCPIWEGALNSLRDVRGTLFLLHSRKASPGMAINLTKLHPFCWPGQDPGLMFCQNGTIRRPERLNTSLEPTAIDTERYFDIVLRHYRETRDHEMALRRAVEEIEAAGADPTSLNALLSDGRELVAWKGRILPENAGYHTLHVREEPDLAVVSTERFELPGKGKGGADAWRPLEGIWRKAF